MTYCINKHGTGLCICTGRTDFYKRHNTTLLIALIMVRYVLNYENGGLGVLLVFPGHCSSVKMDAWHGTGVLII